MRQFTILLAGAAFTFLAHYRNPRAIHLHVENRNPRPDGDWQFQLPGALALLLRTAFDIFSDLFRRALDCFSRDSQICQQLHWFPSLSKKQLRGQP
jgi:hypothetical protein